MPFLKALQLSINTVFMDQVRHEKGYWLEGFLEWAIGLTPERIDDGEVSDFLVMVEIFRIESFTISL